jgi:hypothetical protein
MNNLEFKNNDELKNKKDKIRRLLKNKYKISYHFFNKEEWINSILPNGETTLLLMPPSVLRYDKSCRIVTASGVCNSSPGIHVVRYDLKDFKSHQIPYNIDYYHVWESLNKCPYNIFLTDSKEEFSELVLIEKIEVSQYDYHWAEEIPESIKNARPRK